MTGRLLCMAAAAAVAMPSLLACAAPPTGGSGGAAAQTPELTGVFEAASMAEVRFAPASPAAQLRVVQAVAPGSSVRKGDVLVRGEAGKLPQAVRQKEAEIALGAARLQQAAEELAHMEKSLPEDLAAARRARLRAEADLERFAKVERRLAERDANQEVVNRRNSLEYAKEELRQLEKMYKASDVTGETEQIVLRRQRNTVALAEFLLDKAHLTRDKTVGVDLLRQGEDLAAAKARAVEAERSAAALLPLKLAAQKAEVERLRAAQEQAAADLADLKADLAAMTLAAPADGVVYYGRCVRGGWPAAAAMEAKLAPGGLVQPQEVVATIVQPGGLSVRAAAEEKLLHLLRAGMECTAVPVGYPQVKLTAKVESVSPVPLPSGRFDVRLSIAGDTAALRAGMTCTIGLPGGQ